MYFFQKVKIPSRAQFIAQFVILLSMTLSVIVVGFHTTSLVGIKKELDSSTLASRCSRSRSLTAKVINLKFIALLLLLQ